MHFVTFRQKDSWPADASARWHAARKEWLALRGEALERDGWFARLSPDHRREYGRRFGRALEETLDRGLGTCLLRKPENAALVEQTLRFFDGERYALGDFVVMPNHVHALVIPMVDRTIGSILKSWKSYSARMIHQKEGRSGSFWQHESFDHIGRNRRQLDRLREYIAENPAKANLGPGEYILCPAEWEEVRAREPTEPEVPETF